MRGERVRPLVCGGLVESSSPFHLSEVLAAPGGGERKGESKQPLGLSCLPGEPCLANPLPCQAGIPWSRLL